MARTNPCSPAIQRGRLRKAEQFAAQAQALKDISEDVASIADSYVTLSVLAGIAATDALCCARLGEHATGESHQAALDLVGRFDKAAQRHLSVLLGMKTKAGYSHSPMSGDDCKKAGRASAALLEAARRA